MSKTIYITTSIPYVNAAPHLGHAQEFVLADALARYHRLMGDDARLLSGTDDFALKNVLKAEEAGEDIKTYVTRHADAFESLLKKLNVSNDDFIRTSTDPRHVIGAQKLWSSFRPEDVERKTYKGLYCVGCEEFKLEKDLVDGKCPEHPNVELEKIEEENYFFKLGNYQTQLEELIESGKLQIIPETRKNEVLSFIRSGLHDLSISRSVARARGWGVPVPGDDSQVMYVWVDALSNYINALGYAKDDEHFKKYWSGGEVTHAIGKGITRFHAVYWPAFLLSAGIKTPEKIFVHGYYTVDGQKMSKSLGNTVDPAAIIDEYGADAFRYFVLREASVFEDSDFTAERFREAYNANLVNGLGNLVARIMKLAEDNLGQPIERPEPVAFPKEYTDAIESLEFNRAMDFVWGKIQALDERITKEEPYKLVKSDPEAGKRIIAELAVELYWIGRMLYPFLPDANEKIKKTILENKKPENLFPRLS